MTLEADTQKAIFKWFCLQYPAYKKCFQASLNGISLSGNIKSRARTISIAKSQGMCIGQSDIFLAVIRGGFAGLYVELKEGYNKATDDQLEFGQEMLRQGYDFEIATGFKACQDAIKRYMNN